MHHVQRKLCYGKGLYLDNIINLNLLNRHTGMSLWSLHPFFVKSLIKKFHHEAKTVWAFANWPVFPQKLIRYSSQSKLFPLSEDFGWIHLQYRVYRAFSDDVTSAILVFRNYETAAILASQDNGMAVMLVFQINLVGDELFS